MLRLLTLIVFAYGIAAAVGAPRSLFDAIRAGDVQHGASLLDAYPESVNVRDSLDRTPLHWAARSGHIDLLTLLITHGADVNAVDKNLVTPLHSLSARGFTEQVSLLAAHGADVSAKNVRGDTPLHAAVMTGNPSTAIKLIELGADVNAHNGMARTPLMGACQLGLADVVRRLLDAGADVRADDSDGNAALVYAAGEGQADIVVLLLDYGADAAARDWVDDTPIHAASFSGSADVGELLAASGADLNACNRRGTRPIHNASEQGHVEFLRFLVNRGAHIDVQDSFGRTPLHLAAATGQCEAARLLLKSGASPDIVDSTGVLPHQAAVRNGWEVLAQALRRYTDREVDGETTIIHCARLDELHSSRLLWTGVAVSTEGRVFVNFPRWSPYVTYSVAELLPSGDVKPYPNAAVNAWREGAAEDSHFVCVQSVVCDRRNSLWILDTGNPFLTGVREGGAKLVQVDLATDQVVRTYSFDTLAAPRESYLNDVRIDRESGFAYLTESGLGALLVLNLENGECRRVLDNHFSTEAEDIEVKVGQAALVGADGRPMRVHADGIALTPDNAYIYYQAMTGRTLYRIPTEALRKADLSDKRLGEYVEVVAKSGVCDGMVLDREGRLYLSAVEQSAIKRLNLDGQFEIVAQDPRISWPDSFSLLPDGSVCFTTSRIHEQGRSRDEFKIYRLPPQ